MLNNLLTSKAELIVDRNFNSYLVIWLIHIDNDIVKCAETTYKRVSKLLLGGWIEFGYPLHRYSAPVIRLDYKLKVCTHGNGWGKPKITYSGYYSVEVWTS